MHLRYSGSTVSPGEIPAAHTAGMHTITRWRWRVLDPERGVRYATRHHMTEIEARETDPGAERIEVSRQVLEVPTKLLEHQMTSGWQSRER